MAREAEAWQEEPARSLPRRRRHWRDRRPCASPAAGCPAGVLRGDFDFVARHDATRETILKDMVANKRSAGAFVGTSSAAAAAKEE